MPASRYWFFEWLDRHSVRTVEDFSRTISKPKVLGRLREQGEVASRRQDVVGTGIDGGATTSILAGMDIDLSGVLSCSHIECRIEQIETLFRRAWFYFDRIVVADTLSPHLASDPDNENWVQRITDDVRVLLRIREIGAEDLVSFHRKDLGVCDVHARQTLEAAGLPDLRRHKKEYARELAKHGSIKVHAIRGQTAVVSFLHPILPSSYRTKIRKQEDKKLKTLAAEEAVESILDGIIVDLCIAEHVGIPLGTTHPIYQKFMADTAHNAPTVAFNLSLPVLTGVPIDTLVAIRNQEAELFDAFRDSLRRAIRERIRLEPHERPTDAASEIQKEIIEPELRKIGRRLTVADEELCRKTGVALGVGALLTICGLATGILPVAMLGLGTVAGGAVVPYQQYSDRLGEIELSDMFFLWKAVGHANS